MKLKPLTIQTHKQQTHKQQETRNIAGNKSGQQRETKQKNVANNKDLPFTPGN